MVNVVRKFWRKRERKVVFEVFAVVKRLWNLLKFPFITLFIALSILLFGDPEDEEDDC